MNLGERFLDWTGLIIVPLIIGGVLVLTVAFIAAISFFIYTDMKAERFSLKKDEWVCSASVERASTTYAKIGNVTLPITSYSNHCTQWSEKP